MKTLITLIAICFTGLVNAQVISFNPRTGDLDMDNLLKDINTKAQKDITIFKEEVASKFNLAKNKVDDLLKIMAPGDVYMVAQTAEITAKPIDAVSETYSKNKGKGWGEVAKELGIKPGSKEFHAMKDKMKNKGKSGDKGGKGNSNSQAKGNGKGKGKK